MHPAILQSDTKEYIDFADNALEAAYRHEYVDIVRLLLQPKFKGTVQAQLQSPVLCTQPLVLGTLEP